MASSIWVMCLVLSSDIHCKENDKTTGAVHLIQTFLAISPDIRRVRSLANHRSLLFCQKVWIKWISSHSAISLQWKFHESITPFKCCLPSTDAIDRWEKIHICEWRFKVASSVLQWNPPCFRKKKMSGNFLTDLVCTYKQTGKEWCSTYLRACCGA